ncbi:MAG: glycerol-3-phosphate acyltransferase, partial [Dehalococcoidia bacterium]|nr:glycerol-3-phosphate acyltransferase [Dehalococcoidia bacterium]
MDESVVQYAYFLPISYLLGSVPWGYLLTQTIKGMDVREYGSGSTGTSNVLRTAGGALAAAALVLDVSKGALAVLLARV